LFFASSIFVIEYNTNILQLGIISKAVCIIFLKIGLNVIHIMSKIGEMIDFLIENKYEGKVMKFYEATHIDNKSVARWKNGSLRPSQNSMDKLRQAIPDINIEAFIKGIIDNLLNNVYIPKNLTSTNVNQMKNENDLLRTLLREKDARIQLLEDILNTSGVLKKKSQKMSF